MKNKVVVMKKNEQAFTVMELIVTIAIAALILAFVVPNFQRFVVNQRAHSYASSIVAALRLARVEAINRAVNVEVCPLAATSNVCNYSISDWSNGWRVWIPSTGEIIRNFPSISQNYVAFCCGSVNLQFQPQGNVNTGACTCPAVSSGRSSFSNLSYFQLKPANCTRVLVVNIDSGGQARINPSANCS